MLRASCRSPDAKVRTLTMPGLAPGIPLQEVSEGPAWPRRTALSSRWIEGPYDLIHPWIESGDRERLFEIDPRAEIPPHGFVALHAVPLRVHRHPGAVEAAVKRQSDEARRPAHKLLGHAGEQF